MDDTNDTTTPVTATVDEPVMLEGELIIPPASGRFFTPVVREIIYTLAPVIAPVYAVLEADAVMNGEQLPLWARAAFAGYLGLVGLVARTNLTRS